VQDAQLTIVEYRTAVIVGATFLAPLFLQHFSQGISGAHFPLVFVFQTLTNFVSLGNL